MRNALVLSIALLLASTGPLFAAGEQEEEEGPAGAAATAAEPEIVLVAGRYTWARNWLEVPTASQLGIDRFGEAPALAAMVQAGELPPVEERLPDDPLVIGPYREIGQYGGTLRVARMGPGDYGDMLRGAKGWLFRGDPSTNEIIPYLAKGYEVPADNTSLTIFLREGTKWSDGMPFTADDIMFLYTYGFADPEVKDSWGRGWRFNGELSTFAKVDDYTVRIDFPEPVAPPIWRSHLNWFRSRQEFLFTAAHHMKQYHKAFNPKVEELAKEEGFENWVALWNAAIEIQPRQRYTQPEMGPWIMQSRDSSGKTLVRNAGPVLLGSRYGRQPAALHRRHVRRVLLRSAGSDSQHDAGIDRHRRAIDESGRLPTLQGEREHRRLQRARVAGHQDGTRHLCVQSQP